MVMALQDDGQDDRLVSGAPCQVGSGAPSRMVAALQDDVQDDRLVSGAPCLVGRGAPSRRVAALQDEMMGRMIAWSAVRLD